LQVTASPEKLVGRAMGLAGGIAVMGGGRSDSRSVWTRSVKASGEDAYRESIESSNLRAGLLSHTGQGDRQVVANQKVIYST